MNSIKLEDILSAVEKRDVNALKSMTGKKIDIPIFSKLDLRGINVIFRTKSENDVVRFNCDITDPNTFSYVPQGCAKLGRMNYPGQSIFYGSLFPETNLKELVKDNLQIGQKFYVSRWAVKKDNEIKALTIIRPEYIKAGLTEAKDFYISDPDIVGKYGENLQALSKLMLKNDSEDNFINHCASAIIANAFYKNVDAIWYPSVRNSMGEFVNANVAILPKTVDKDMSLVSVVKGKLLYDKETLDIEEIGFNQNGKIEWYKVSVGYDDIVWQISDIVDEKGNHYTLDNCQYENEDGVPISKNEMNIGIRKFHKEIVSSKVFFDIHSSVFNKFCGFSALNEIKSTIEVIRLQNVEGRYIRKRGKLTKVKWLVMSGMLPITINVKEG